MKEIAPDIFVESQYAPYNLGLIRTEHGGLVIDIPPHPEDAARWWDEAEAVAGPLRYAVLTDAQPERLLAATYWKKTPLIAAKGFLQRLDAYDERGWQELLQELARRYPGYEQAILACKPRRPNIAFDDRFLLHYPPHPLEFQAVAGVAAGSLWVFSPNQGLLFAGESVALDEPPVLEYIPNSHALLNTLSALAGRNSVQKIVPGHGHAPAHRGDLESMREYLRVVRRAARSLARSQAAGSDVTHAAQDLMQTFFPSRAHPQPMVQRIRRGLERLVEEINEAQPEENDEARPY